MTLALSVTEDDVFTALRAFLLGFIDPAVEVVQGQNNRVPEPVAQTYIVMTPMHRSRLAVSVNNPETGQGPTTTIIEANSQFDMQLDLHGPGGSDLATLIVALFMDQYGVDAFNGTPVAPLFATEGHQIPFVNGEDQYENRWVMTVAMQIKPTVSTPLQFAATLTPTVYPV